ncbi:MAG: hypothetical protein IK147_01905 [Clostridia bacterium]|nr:hypothetical protein [Clostridia bacterium]
MKKSGKYLLAAILLVSACFGVACGGNGNWKGQGVSDSSDVYAASLGGFVAETEDYVYFINGMATHTDDNTFGTPVKGALAAVKKSDFGAGKAVITVPELFTAKTYVSGLYIAKENGKNYVYYGTANRDKDSSGNVASAQMTFTKTSLDGKETEKLFTLSSHYEDYTIAENNGVVYVVYYDEDAKAIKSFNCSDKTTAVVAVTDEKVNEEKDGEYLSLDSYKFVKSGGGVSVVYTVKAYNEKYYEDKAAKEGYSRGTAAYNYLYSYTVGEDAKLEKSGKENGETYAITSVIDDYLFYTATDENSVTKTFGVKLTDFDDVKEINSADNIKTDMIINSFEEVYYFDTDAVIRTTLIGNEFSVKETVAKVEGVSDMYFIDDGALYYRNGESYLMRVTLDNNEETETPVRVSADTVSSIWYAPELVEIGGKKYVLYCDNSDNALEYVGFADLDGEVIEENDAKYIDGATIISVMTDADVAKSLGYKITDITSPLTLNEKDGKLYSETVEKLRAEYDALSDDVKALVTDAAIKTLENAEAGVELANLFSKLDGAKKGFDKMTDEEKTAFKTQYKEAYDAAAAKAEELKAVSDAHFKAVRAYVEDNYNYYYQEAVKIFTETVSD